MTERDAARYDAIVVGLGAMGSASLFEIARRGKRVLGVDRFEPPHTMGSTHGKSRIIREAYFEDPGYVPLVGRAFEKWEEIERLSGRRMFERTGGLMLGPAEGRLVIVHAKVSIIDDRCGWASPWGFWARLPSSPLMYSTALSSTLSR